MTTLKIRGLFASLALSALFMVGSVATAHANGTDKEKEKKNETKVEAPKKLVTQTWYFTGTSSDNPELASNYSLSSTGLPPCGLAEDVICQIEAPEESGLPKMDAPVDGTTVQLQIRAAHQSISDNNPTPNTTVKEFRSE
ncbi:hypothetical protein FAZ15_17295 [Sphingobacterium olei]|uniref:Uncharacterized protein n=1 Tax=Sphingobacterium olei TaxID=2571155 RepID=A0A4U0NI30_9SPHI|nr:hypothetical protein [Sphingobacterium olei]TJZ53780.1 hypothetical protein FAZ15_17295 [Sphingobacterium olei]